MVETVCHRKLVAKRSIPVRIIEQVLHLWVPSSPEADGVVELPKLDVVPAGTPARPAALLLISGVLGVTAILEELDPVLEDAVEEKEDNHDGHADQSQDQEGPLHGLR